MKDVKINVYDLEKVYLRLNAEVNLLEAWNKREDSFEIRVLVENIRKSIEKLECMVYGLEDV